MKMLVTGGCGFIGTNFILYMRKKHPDYKIINLDKLNYAGNIRNLEKLRDDSKYKFVYGDICNKELVNELVKEVDVIVHFAAESHVLRSVQDCAPFIESNILGTQVLLESARKNGNKRFHHVSTDEVFGSIENGKFDEKSNYNPLNPYAASKAGSDHFVRMYYHTYGLPITISNCTNNYGPYQYPEKVVPLWITNLLDGKNIPVHGEGLEVRDWIYVDDHNKAVDLIIHKGKIGETYCIGGNKAIKNIELAKKILKIMNLGEDKIKFIENRKGQDFRYAMNSSKIKNELGWEPQVDFEEGLIHTINWYKQNPEWWKPLKALVESNPDIITL